VSTKLNATAKNGGSISYKGSPEVKELVESGGTVSKEEEGSAL
jgi:hypothetical protein